MEKPDSGESGFSTRLLRLFRLGDAMIHGRCHGAKRECDIECATVTNYAAHRAQVAALLGDASRTIVWQVPGDEIEVTIATPDDLDKLQIGYAVGPDGASLADGDGTWQVSWLVIGSEDLLGDPVLVDLDNPSFPVYTAMHGTGKWDLILLAPALSEFLSAT